MEQDKALVATRTAGHRPAGFGAARLGSKIFPENLRLISSEA
jgi:hypothetical protein